jgi:DNA modification methylase
VPDCDHEWISERKRPEHPDRSSGGKDFNGSGVFVDNIPRGTQEAKNHRGASFSYGATCTKCGAWKGSFGLEPTPELYVAHAVEIFREVRRVLRDDGTLWLNLGDSYANYGSGGNGATGGLDKSTLASPMPPINTTPVKKSLPKNLKPKDLVGIPWMIAFALRADGWYLRSDIIWNKPNPMPESVTDRPTKSHEYIFLLSKSANYFYDNEAVKEKTTGNAHSRGNGVNPKALNWKTPDGWDTTKGEGGHGVFHKEGREKGVQNYRPKQNESFAAAVNQIVLLRNIRSVWTIPTQPFKDAHFATFPEKLVEPCIKAGASQRGCCPECGAPWVRITRKIKSKARKVVSPHAAVPGQRAHGTFFSERYDDPAIIETCGWKPSCQCQRADWREAGKSFNVFPIDPIPCTVLDPFAGSGTVGVMCEKLGRDFIGIELNPSYFKMAEKRIYEINPLFAETPKEQRAGDEQIDPLLQAVNEK